MECSYQPFEQDMKGARRRGINTFAFPEGRSKTTCFDFTEHPLDWHSVSVSLAMILCWSSCKYGAAEMSAISSCIDF